VFLTVCVIEVKMKRSERHAAKARGETHYYTGKPCCNGHTSQRLVSNGKCCVCNNSAATAWASKNKERRQQINREHMNAKRDQYAEYNKKYRAENHHRVQALQTARGAKYKAAKKKATPKWITAADIERIQVFYLEASWVTKRSGVPHEVDHIVPLQGETVCGLHVPWNLRVITKSFNASKQHRSY
jgi:hypothetical protein